LKADQLNGIEPCYDDTSSSEAETREINSMEVQNLEEDEEYKIYESKYIPEIHLYEIDNLNYVNYHYIPKKKKKHQKNHKDCLKSQ